MGPVLARRVALVLAGGFAIVLALAWLALASLTPGAGPGAGHSVPARSVAPSPGTLLPPAAVLSFRAPLRDGPLTAATLLDPVSAAVLNEWSDKLRDRAGTRVTLTLSSGDGIDPVHQQRVGAALVRLLTAGDLNPHRVQLVLAPTGSVSLSPGEFRLAIEMGRP